jgi:hypothetical protein
LPDQQGAVTTWDPNARSGHPASSSMQQHGTGFLRCTPARCCLCPSSPLTPPSALPAASLA